MTLQQFLCDVDELIDTAIADAVFHPTQRLLLNNTVCRYRPLSAANPLADPLWRSTLYFVARACGRQIDEQTKRVAAFCSLYLLAADLMDDVQDDDLKGKPHEFVGPAIAINNAVGLLFLALKFLEQAVTLESRPERVRRFYQLFNHTSILAVAGQHRDLMGAEGALLPNEVLEMLRARNSSLSMIVACGALLGGCDDQELTLYAELGEKIVLYGQIREDLSDIFGKDFSPDLGTHKVTYPIACFLEAASDVERNRFRELLHELPGSLRDVRALLYHSGSVQRAADMMESLREQIHDLVGSTGNRSAYLRCLLSIVDGFAQCIYDPPCIDSSRHLFEPEGRWHRWVRDNLAIFIERMGQYDLPAVPLLRPWHLPQWMYDPNQRTIFYPDIEGLREEILPLQTELLGIGDCDEVARLLWDQVPATLAHEMFHSWRHVLGHLSSDHWHEEWVANRLAVAYLREFEPNVLQTSVQLAERTLGTRPESLDEQTRTLLASCHLAMPEVRQSYAMSLEQIWATTCEMIRQLSTQESELSRDVEALLHHPQLHDTDVAA